MTDDAQSAPHSGYVSSVGSPVQLALGIGSGVVLAVIFVAVGLWPIGVVGLVVLVASAFWFSVVRLTVTASDVTIQQGRGKRGIRDIRTRDIRSWDVAKHGWRETFGLAGESVGSTTYVARVGTGLLLVFEDERLNITARDPETAGAVLTAAGVARRVAPAAPEPEETKRPRPKPRPAAER